MATTVDIQQDWRLLLKYLPANYEALAHEFKLLETQYGNAKITTAEQLLRLFFVHVGAELPLRDTAALVAASGGPDISPNRIHMKLRQAGPYLQALIEQMYADRERVEPERWGDYEMIAVDGSSVSGPGATGTDARLHAAIRLSDLHIQHAIVTDPSEGETFRRFFFLPGQLILGDRGYSNPAGIAWVADCEADVLVRLNRGALPLFKEEHEPLDIVAWARGLAANTPAERKVWVHAKTERGDQWIAGRLIGVRLPNDKAEEARRRVREEQGRNATAETLEMASYVLLFTTAAAERLPTQRALDAYRLRWQVELLFKRWKSLGGMDRVPTTRTDTTLAWLSTKLLLGLLVERMSDAASSRFSPLRLHPDRPSKARRRRTPARSPALEADAAAVSADSHRDSIDLAG